MYQFWRQGRGKGGITKCQSQQQTKRVSEQRGYKVGGGNDVMILNTHNHPVLSNLTTGNDPPLFNENSSDDQFLLQSHFENYWTLLTFKFFTHFCLNSEWDIKQVLLSLNT